MSSKKALDADNQQAIENKVSNEYLSGFVDGEGCFYVGFGKREDLPLKWQIITEFHLSQNPGGKNVLEEFSRRLGCGYLKPNHPGSSKDKSWVLIVKDRKNLKEKLIPFFKKYPLHTSKRVELSIFEFVLSLIEKKEHLTREGFQQIVEKVFQNPRVTNKRYSKEVLLS
ncbi:MAG: hypothetical protein A3B43_02825 [Candidatus Levybacteria bacterium RIFCSPLOWO2_01_FULL_38_120]|nr:MAG: hypothetical protein A3B43_02825 [Candidatus Levybacteria bacterium RIFCSPLOWO2_01_FULL_38_120]OGH45152.1 MAG: hypothetical protein A3H82_00705 [Candidatus Levybacteria bacterium RIFCSPLOWO2_02_FULL_39_26]